MILQYSTIEYSIHMSYVNIILNHTWLLQIQFLHVHVSVLYYSYITSSYVISVILPVFKYKKYICILNYIIKHVSVNRYTCKHDMNPHLYTVYIVDSQILLFEFACKVWVISTVCLT